ncbi:helix-turn-helix domain-containing protein [Roseomonas sp. GCM10028921]
MQTTEPSLADLAAASGLLPRTIRSWVAQGLLPAPLTRGPTARYPTETLERVLAIRSMRDDLGMSLADIRQELLVAAPEKIRAHAARAAALAPEPDLAAPDPTTASDTAPPPPGRSSALDYVRELRAKPAMAAVRASADPSVAPPPPASGFEALEQRLGQGHTRATRKARAEEWLRIPITPDVEIAIRGRLDAEQRVRLERCADLIRDILLGRDK